MTRLDLKKITQVRIHPAIGIARVGNSPHGTFVGPECPGIPPHPDDGRFKDAQSQVKRQAARFRCFGYNEAGDQWVELKHDDRVSITWNVELANKKACSQHATDDDSWRNRPRDKEHQKPTAEECRKLTINSGSMQVSGPNKKASGAGEITLEGETVPVFLGEVKTEADGNLLVLGGRGSAGSPKNREAGDPFDNNGWWDDTSDGPVTATVKIDGVAVEEVLGAWVVVAPPKFAPQLDTVTTLWDRLQDHFAALTNESVGTPSYTRDIQPVLQRARMMGAVHEGADGNHSRWPEPLYGFYARRKIDSWLRKASDRPEDQYGKKMPVMNGEDGCLTPRQLAVLQKWRDNEFTRDWKKTPTPPSSAITPHGLDRAALEACVGKAFFPGIEAGRVYLRKDVWQKKPKDWDRPYQAFRFSDKVKAGDLTARMAIPWQADFNACGTDWWPVPRPNQVIPEGEAEHQGWTRDWVGSNIDMTRNWSYLGFIVADQYGRFREVDRAVPEGFAPQALPDGQWSTTVSADGHPGVWQPAGALTGVDLAAYGRGELPPGAQHVWPVLLTEEDRSVEITVRAPVPAALAVRVVTPLGPPVAAEDPHLSGTISEEALVLRLALPVEVMPGRYADQGRWEIRISSAETAAAVPYQITVATESGIRIGEADVRLGDTLAFGTALTGHRVRSAAVMPADTGADADAEVPLELTAPGMLSGTAGLGRGVSAVRLRVVGASRLGYPFIRERFFTVGDRG